MTKSELSEAVAKRAGVNATTAQLVIEAFMTEVSNTLTNGENVYLRTFGTFQLKKRKPKKAQNMNTGQTIDVPARTVVNFKPSDSLADKVVFVIPKD